MRCKKGEKKKIRKSHTLAFAVDDVESLLFQHEDGEF
jgi:hypothetical protein